MAASRSLDKRTPLVSVGTGSALLSSSRRARPGTSSVKLSILMCAYNEERTISRAVSEVLAVNYPCDMELIVVDDGSTDATADLLGLVNDPRVTIHRHPRNQGKGAALLSAASLATGTHILPFDADLEYSPDDIARLIWPAIRASRVILMKAMVPCLKSWAIRAIIIAASHSIS